MITFFLNISYISACGSLATSPPGQTGGSLLHSLVRQSQREKLKMDAAKSEDHPVAERLFNVLGNAVWSSECRNVLWKVKGISLQIH